jgi:protein required for attachment to host cells
MIHRPRLWIAIADGEHARIVVQQAPEGGLHTSHEITSPDAGEQSRDLGSDRPGRVHESMGQTRHAIAPKHDLHAMRKAEFLKSVAKQIDEAAGKDAFDSLVLVAPSHEIGILRDALGRQASDMLVGTLGKDLTKVPDHDLKSHLAEWL